MSQGRCQCKLGEKVIVFALKITGCILPSDLWNLCFLQVTPHHWVAPSTPLVRFQLVAHPQARKCRLDQEEPRWMALTLSLWGSRTGVQHHLIRTNCISSELKSWPTRCWPGGNPCLTTCRWQCRASDRCLGCSSRCQHYLHPLCLQQDLALALAQALAQAQDQHLQITAGPMVRPTISSPWGRESLNKLITWGQ